MRFPLVMALAAIVPLGGQTAPGKAHPKTPWGDPDLQGVWTGTEMIGVPLQRPAAFGTRQFLTDEEFARRQATRQEQGEFDTAEFVSEKIKCDPTRGTLGNTLVVETTNFTNRPAINGAALSDAARLVERFSRGEPGTLDYEANVDHPKTWTKPWKIAFPWKQGPGYHLYEYACHEGNHAMSNALTGARAEVRAAARK